MLGRAALDSASSSGCELMATEPTHIDGWVLDLVLTDIQDLVEIRVGSPVETSDHSSIFWMCWCNLTLTWFVDRKSI